METEVRERFERLEGIVASLIQLAQSHEDRLDRLVESQARTDEQIKHTQEELNVLVHMVDDWIRRNPRT